MSEAEKAIQSDGLGGLPWRVYTPGLLIEILSNNGMAILSTPLNIFGKLLALVGERAAQLDDAKLNALMCRLALYSVADPDSPDYDPELVERTIAAAEVTAPDRCDCVTRANTALRETNRDARVLTNLTTGRVAVATVRANGKPGPLLFASFCPFCGRKYD